MSIDVSRAASITTAALDYRANRQDMIASNIANADTPNYQARDISFEDALKAKQAAIFKDDSNQLKMASTNSQHLSSQKETAQYKPTIYLRDGHMARNDGNSVDIDVETTEMSKNSIMFNALISAKKIDGRIFRSVIEASQKVN